MKLEEPLKAAGVDTGRARLVAAAEAALKGAKWGHDAALGKLVSAIDADARLLRSLHQITEADSRARASALLLQLIEDAKGPKREGSSQWMIDSRLPDDHPHPAPIDSSRASHRSHESHIALDRPAAPISKGGACQWRSEGQSKNDRPSRSISTTAARALLKSSVFDKRIVETFDHRWGDITQHDYLNLRIKNAFSAEVERGLSKVQWPDMHTPLRQFCSEKQVQSIAESAERARQSALTAVKAVAHG